MTKQLQNISIARVSTVPLYVLTQLNEQIEAIQDAGAQVTVVTSNKDANDEFNLSEKFEFIPIFIPREINIYNDLIALYKLWCLFRARQFDIVHSTTPKAGLLCAIAAKLAFIPIRLHTFTGQTWVTLKGVKRRIVRFCDKIIGWGNTRCYADSPSQREFLIANNIITNKKSFILGSGSLAGVNLQRFSPTRYSEAQIIETRLRFGIDNNQRVVLFVGRITKDKGVFELFDAFEQIVKKHSDVTLLLVGPLEQNLSKQFIRDVSSRCYNRVIFSGFSTEPEQYMAIADLLCIPSYREGFGTVVIEAAAMGLPVIGTKIYGLSDAVVDGVTGLLVEPRSVSELTKALDCLLTDNELRIEMGNNAKERAINDFDSKHFNSLVVREYEQLLSESKHTQIRNKYAI